MHQSVYLSIIDREANVSSLGIQKIGLTLVFFSENLLANILFE